MPSPSGRPTRVFGAPPRSAPGQYEFYLPGERATDVNGNKWVCGPDGQWFRDYSAIRFVGNWVSQVVAPWAVVR